MWHNQLKWTYALLLQSLFDSDKVARLGNRENNGATNTDLKKFLSFTLLHDKVLNLRQRVQLFILLLSYMVHFILLIILLVVRVDKRILLVYGFD